MSYRRIGAIKEVEEFRGYLAELGTTLPIDDETLSAASGSSLAGPMRIGSRIVGNRWAIQPMEGWDGTEDGQPTEPTLRRWRNFGQSGAKLIWGGEAFAVRRDGRANPNQLYHDPRDINGIRRLRETLIAAHRERFGPRADHDLLVGLQLTHSGRFSRPSRKDRPEPRIVYHHPVLDRRLGIAPDDDSTLLTDSEVERLIDDYIACAKMAEQVGFDFVDVKACHGYLGHEFLSAFDRPGPYGGDFLGRTRFLRSTIGRIRQECPALIVGVRLSLFDTPPFTPDVQRGEPGKLGPGVVDLCPPNYPGFGCNRDDPLCIDLAEPIRLLRELHEDLGVQVVNLTAGSPYYNPHVQRPAYFPPSDGYQPPEDPLVGCARQMHAVRLVKAALPALPIVGSSYSYFQQFLPHVAQAAVRDGWVDFVGLGRLVLSYWDLPADHLAGVPLKAKRFCRTFSDCTTAPRTGLPSGCYPLDDYYKDSPQAAQLKIAKAELRQRLAART